MKDYLRIDGKVAIVTGSGRGIGRGIALALASYGVKVMVTDINDENGNNVKKEIIDAGGMPSSHSATVCGLTTAAALKYGAGSFEFAISFILAMVVMYDAVGVRQETGKQARLLNSILLENPLKLSSEVLQQKLKEYVGHTPIQVVAGAILGIVLALVINNCY